MLKRYIIFYIILFKLVGLYATENPLKNFIRGAIIDDTVFNAGHRENDKLSGTNTS